MRWKTRTDEDDWYDEDDEPDYVEPYVIVERQEAGIGPFLIGLAIGAGAALLFAPQSGHETRRGIARSARRAQDAAQDFVGVEDRIEATLDAVDDKRRRVSNAFHAGRAAAREARGELEQRIAESKAAYKET